MYFLPYRSYTITSPYGKEENISLLEACTKKPKLEDDTVWIRNKNEPQKKFLGGIKESGFFTITPSVIHTQSYLPLITGEISQTKSGSIIFMKMKPLSGTLLIFLLAIGITLVSSFFFWKSDHLFYCIGFLIFLALTYIVGIANFNMHAKRSYEQLLEVFEI